jgi:hypothetical protein
MSSELIDPRTVLRDWKPMRFGRLMQHRGPWLLQQLKEARRYSGRHLIWVPGPGGVAMMEEVQT